jgi:hypothetical protein
MAVYYERHTERRNTVSGKNIEFLNVNPVVSILISDL